MIYILIIAILGFLGLFLTYKLWKLSAIYCFAIGSAVNANIFHIGSYPIQIFDLTFGMDSIIYTLFAFCVFIAFYNYSKNDAWALTYSSMGAIAFSAIVLFVGDWSKAGTISVDVVWSLGSFFASIFATFVAIFVMFKVCEKLRSKKVNVYLNLMLCIFIVSLINSFIYFGIIAIISGGFAEGFLMTLLASYIGKIFATLFAVVVYFLLSKAELNKNAKKQENEMETEIE